MIEIWQKITEILNVNNNCGLCFEFVGAGRSDYFNTLQPRLNANGDCCVYIGLLGFGGRKVIRENTNGLYPIYIEERFDLIIGIPSRLDLQFYNENSFIDTNESKYIKYLKPIRECLIDTLELLCTETEFSNLEINELDWNLVLNQFDINLDGYRIKGSFRKYIN